MCAITHRPCQHPGPSIPSIEAATKITEIEPIHAGQFLFVRIKTDAGLHGVGKGGVWGHIEDAKTVVDKFATYLVEKDPFPIEHHWNATSRNSERP